MDNQIVSFDSMPMVDLDSFLPRITAPIVGVDRDMALTMIVDSAIEVAKKTRGWVHHQCFALQDCVTAYSFQIPHGRIDEVRSSRLFNKHTGHDLPQSVLLELNPWLENGTIYVDIDRICHMKGMTLDIGAVLVPTRDAAQLPADFFEDYLEAITHLALSKLYLVRGSNWYSLTMGREHAAFYRVEVQRLLAKTATKNRAIKPRVSAKRWM